jgi:hypothetical protein
LEWRRRKPGADRKCPPRSASQSLRRSIHPWLLELTIASSDITLELISLLEGAWTHRRFRSWLLATRIPSGRSSFALTLRGPTYAPQVTHDHPQIFPLTDRFLPLFEVWIPRVNRRRLTFLSFDKTTIATMESATADIPKLERRSSAPVKRRVSRACDHCHRMRTRCNGQSPCSRCIELEYVCQYNREKKRRGKVCITPVTRWPDILVSMDPTMAVANVLGSSSARCLATWRLTLLGPTTHPETKRRGCCCRTQPANTWTGAKQRLFREAQRTFGDG